MQFVPEIVRDVAHLSVFQRTGNWFLPRRNRPYPRWWKAAVAHVPGLQRWRRRFITEYTESLTLMIRHPSTLGRIGRLWSTLFMRMQVREPELRRRIWPDYTFGCKRILFSSHYLPALSRPNVSLSTEKVTEIVPEGVRTADGTTHEVDTIIWGTGFAARDFMFPMEIVGPGGRTLSDEWADGPHAHLGMTVPGFPSLFVLYGPNTNTSGGSIILYLEAQTRYMREALQRTTDRGASAIEVRRDVEAASDAEVQARFPGTAWVACDSWYRDEGGRIVTNWPGYMREYLDRTKTVDTDEYVFHVERGRRRAPSPGRGAGFPSRLSRCCCCDNESQAIADLSELPSTPRMPPTFAPTSGQTFVPLRAFTSPTFTSPFWLLGLLTSPITARSPLVVVAVVGLSVAIANGLAASSTAPTAAPTTANFLTMSSPVWRMVLE